MNVKINSVHFRVDKKLEDFIKDKLQKMPNLFEGVFNSEVILKVENSENRDNKVVEIRLMIRGYDLFAKKHSVSFEQATDLAVEALRKQLVRHKEKIKRI